ncbi:hypothetical protein GCM10022240_10360 [Microbacterium kribbense]|uniref:Uncharacterized protein n=1 Tax=Microbacterium kribbense TaxID=433645 RepID=A0ABP7G9Z5_9MICO
MPFSNPVSLSDAANQRTVLGYPVEGYRFENPEIVGEFSPLSGLSVADFLRDFKASYGTQPQVVGAIIEVPKLEAIEMAKRVAATPIAAPGDEFEAPPVDASRSSQLQAFRKRNPDLEGSSPAHAAAKTGAQVLTATNWRPTQADIQIFRANTSTVYFSQYYYWDGTTARTSVLPADDGWEAEVNIFTSRPDSETCGSGHPEDYPFAKNYGWTWSAFVNTGSGMTAMASAVGAYADYNDDSDPCNRNSMAIGVRTPQSIPAYSSGAQEVMFTIFAPRGLDNTGRIGGVVQAVNETGCVLQPWLSNTDCMGLTTSTSGTRATLAESRNWTAPPKCWMSLNYGNTAPTTYTC